jgi:hypothetical protein
MDLTTHLSIASLVGDITSDFIDLPPVVSSCINLLDKAALFSHNYSNYRQSYNILISLEEAGKRTIADSFASNIITNFLSTHIKASPIISFLKLADPLAQRVINSSDHTWKTLITDLEYHKQHGNWIQFGLVSNSADKMASVHAIASMVAGSNEIISKCVNIVSDKLYTMFNGYCDIIKSQLSQFSLISPAMAEELPLEKINIINRNFNELNLISEQVIKPILEQTNLITPVNIQIDQKIKDILNNHSLLRFEKMLKWSFRVPEEIALKYKTNLEIQHEIEKLDGMIDMDQDINIIINQRNTLITKINNIEDSNKLIHNITHGLDGAGKIISNLAILTNNPELAHHATNTINFATQAILIGSGFNGVGVLAGTNPYVLGLMATGACLQFISGINTSKNEGMTIFLHGMMSNIMKAFENLNNYLRENFNKLFSRLDRIEQTIITKIIDLKYINYEIIDQLEILTNRSQIHWAFMSDSVHTINEQIENIKIMIDEKEARDIITSLGQFIATIFYNTDFTLYSSYRNQLMGHLNNCFASSNQSLIGKQFSEFSNPLLSLQPLIDDIKPIIYSKRLMYESLKSHNPEIYLSPFMNFLQVISNDTKLIIECSLFETFINQFTTGEQKIGIFPIDIADSSIIIYINKETKCGTIYAINPIPIYISFKLIKIIETLKCHFKYVTYIHHDNNVIAYNLIYHLINNSSLAIDELIKPSDDLLKTKECLYNIVHHHTYHTLFQTLMFMMAKQYVPKNKSDAELTRIDHNEIEQIFNIGDIIQQNYDMIRQIAKPSIITGLFKDLEINSQKLCQELTRQLGNITQDLINPTWQIFINTTLIAYTKFGNFDQEVKLTQLSNWGTGHEDYYNDRCGYSRKNISRDIGGYLSGYNSTVQSGFNEIKRIHKEYVDQEIDRLKISICPMRFSDYSHIITYDNLAYQLPFYMFPYDDDMPVLPFTKKMRDYSLEKIMHNSEFKKMGELCYHNKGQFKIYYRLEMKPCETFSKNPYLLIHLRYNTELAFATIIHDYEPVFNGITLLPSDGIFSWLFGGQVLNGSDYPNIENWHSHIAGNHSHGYVHVPRTGYRPPINLDDHFSKGWINFNATIRDNPNDNHKKIYLDGIKLLLTPITSQILYNNLFKLYQKYLISWRKIETWDYWSFRQITKSFYGEYLITRETFLAYFENLNKTLSGSCDDLAKIIENKFNLFADVKYYEINYIEKIFRDNWIVGHSHMIDCMKEGANIMELFAPYINRGESTPEIARKMATGICNGLKRMHLLINRLDEFSSDPERETKIDEFIEELRKSISDGAYMLKSGIKTGLLEYKH